jgi:hypothetical protein
VVASLIGEIAGACRKPLIFTDKIYNNKLSREHPIVTGNQAHNFSGDRHRLHS